MSYRYLTMAERNVIHNLRMFGQSQTQIVRSLGRSPSTIGRRKWLTSLFPQAAIGIEGVFRRASVNSRVR